MPLIRISVRQSKIAIDPARIQKTARKILSGLGCIDAELSIAIVNDRRMRQLNREYRNVDRATDVLAFPMAEGEFGDICPDLLGDVVISAATAFQISQQQGCPLAAVLDLLLIHGILHLTGHDHETGPGEARAMARETSRLLRLLGHAEDAYTWCPRELGASYWDDMARVHAQSPHAFAGIGRPGRQPASG